VRCRLVEHDDGGPLEEHPGDGEALLLAPRHSVSPLPTSVSYPSGSAAITSWTAGRLARRDHLGVGGVGPDIAQVGADVVVEQVGVLAHTPMVSAID